jgi:hypothetical protein
MNPLKNWLPAAGAAIALFCGATVAHDHMFKLIDEDKDGKVSADEFEEHSEQKFKMADTDGNGSLSADELKAMQARKD